MKANGEMIILQEKAYLCLLTEAFIKVNGEMGYQMDMVFILAKRKNGSIKENG
jgi:hypothetical protein